MVRSSVDPQPGSRGLNRSTGQTGYPSNGVTLMGFDSFLQITLVVEAQSL